MSPRKLLYLTAVVLLLFAFILLFERKMPSTAERDQKGDLHWELPEDRIESVKLERAGQVVELKKEGSVWKLVKPEPYPADSFAVSDLVSQLALLKRSGGESGEARPQDYGFQAPIARATLIWSEKDEPAKKISRTLEFGIEIPGTEASAARIAGENRVLFVPTSVATAVKKTAEDFKSKDVFGGSSSSFARLEVDRGRGRLSLAKKNGIWWLTQPLSDLADADAVNRIVDDLTGLKALEFLPVAERQNLASLGLAPPIYRVTLADDKSGTTVDFGSTRSDGNSVYARRESQILTVPSTILEELSREAVAFREARLVRFDRTAVASLEGLFGGASFSLVHKDGSWSAAGRALVPSAAEELLSALLDVKSRSFLESPADASLEPLGTVTVKLQAGDPWVAKFLPGREGHEATVSGRPGAFLVSADTVSKLREAFEKTVAALSPTPAPTKKP